MTKFIPISQPSIGETEVAFVTDAVKSGWVSSLGKYIEDLEQNFAKFCGTKYCVSVANGTVGIHLALVALDIGEGDEVIVPDFTFIATANAVRHAGATPIFVDVDPVTLCIDPAHVKAKITANTKAIMPVHIYGHPADMDAINKIAADHGLVVIEDAAESHGAKYKGKVVGSLGACGVFSLYGNKIITSGEGGLITTNDLALRDKLTFLRDHAMSKSKRYWHELVGYNYRMTNLQAALGCAQLGRISDFIQRRVDVFKRYEKNLKGVPGIRLNQTADYAENVYWMVCLEVIGMDETKRSEFMGVLRDMGVDSRPYFYPMSDMPMYNVNANTPVTHEVYKRGVNLPTFFDIKDEQVDYICECIKKALGR